MGLAENIIARLGARVSLGLLGGVCALLVAGGPSRAEQLASRCAGQSSVPAPAASSGTSSSSPYQPAAQEILACVGSQQITGATFTHWVTIAQDSLARSRRRPASEPSHEEMTDTMSFLISADWVRGEALARGVRLPQREVEKRFQAIRREQFPRAAQFRRFLASSGETVSDLLFRVRLDMLSQHLQRLVAGHGGSRRRERRLKRFVKGFSSRWRRQTYCEQLYAVDGCGHTSPSLP